jgi:hypothetical protein
MRTFTYKFSFKIALVATFLFALINAASSSNFNSGKTKKKHSSRSALTFNMHNKSLNLSLSNGFYLKGGMSFSKNLKTDMIINMNSLYFQKGNSIYVIPMKQKVVLSKFKTPQKSIF